MLCCGVLDIYTSQSVGVHTAGGEGDEGACETSPQSDRSPPPAAPRHAATATQTVP